MGVAEGQPSGGPGRPEAFMGANEAGSRRRESGRPWGGQGLTPSGPVFEGCCGEVGACCKPCSRDSALAHSGTLGSLASPCQLGGHGHSRGPMLLWTLRLWPGCWLCGAL